MTNHTFSESAKRTIRIESTAIEQLLHHIDDQFTQACEFLLQLKGRIIVLGMGKSGHIGGKIAATLASTGSPAFFVHPAEASHGDMGMITRDDAVLLLSNSGKTAELVALLPLFKRLSIPIISITSQVNSLLAQSSDCHLHIGTVKEACPLNLAPTSSTSATLVIGDALAVALLEARGFTAEDFAFSHPGGSLGKKLLLKVKDIMHTGDRLPRVTPDTSLKDALIEMTQKGLGMTLVMEDQQLRGVFTDGDLRRALDQHSHIESIVMSQVMTEGGHSAHQEMLAAQALELMQSHHINGMIITNDEQQPIGVINMHDLLKAGVL